jgi:hypothetical protein
MNQQQQRITTASEWRDQVLRCLLLDHREYYAHSSAERYFSRTVEWICLTGQLWHAWLDQYNCSLVECLETLDVEDETLRSADLLPRWCHEYIDVWHQLAKQTSLSKGQETRLGAEQLVQLLGRLGQAYSRCRALDKTAFAEGDVTQDAALVNGASWSKILSGAFLQSSSGGTSSSGTMAWDLWQSIQQAHCVVVGGSVGASSRPLLDTIFYTQLLSAVAGGSESATAHNGTTTTKDDQSFSATAVNHHGDSKSLRLSPQPAVSSANATTKTVEGKLDSLLHTMRQDALSAPDAVAYNIVIRFYAARCGDQNSSGSATALAKLQNIVQQMKVDGVALDAACHASLVYGYARAGQIELAQTTLQQMPIDADNDRVRFLRLVGESVCRILAAHRQAIVTSVRANEATDPKQRRLDAVALRHKPQVDATGRCDLLKRAETFYQTILQQGIVDSATEGVCRIVARSLPLCNVTRTLTRALFRLLDFATQIECTVS